MLYTIHFILIDESIIFNTNQQLKIGVNVIKTLVN